MILGQNCDINANKSVDVLQSCVTEMCYRDVLQRISFLSNKIFSFYL